jgi:thiamine kinase-like enzyme
MSPGAYIQARENKVERSIIDGQLYLPLLAIDTSNQQIKEETAKQVVLQLLLDGSDAGILLSTQHCSKAYPVLQVDKVVGGNTNELLRVSGIHLGVSLLRDATAAATMNGNGNGNDTSENDNSVQDDDVQEEASPSAESVTLSSSSSSSLSSSQSIIDSDYLFPDVVLIRIFGGHGLIDRDVETCTFAALNQAGIAPAYYGRFQNGRLEGWLDGMRPLDVVELSQPVISKAIATQLGRLHASFVIPSHLTEYHDPTKPPSLWTQLYQWLEQATHATFCNEHDTRRVQELLNVPQFHADLKWLQSDIVPVATAKLGFCHNDILHSNVLWNDDTKEVQLIDFEYGGMNYLSFDIANHFNEYAGGTNGHGIPNYDWFPTPQQQAEFVTTYWQALQDHTTDDDNSGITTVLTEAKLEELLDEITSFILANHLYWTLWAINSASTEGCDTFDYLLYAQGRLQQYHKVKEQVICTKPTTSNKQRAAQASQFIQGEQYLRKAKDKCWTLPIVQPTKKGCEGVM